jgi:ribosomal protein S18 acetylase RimI-like enzyme
MKICKAVATDRLLLSSLCVDVQRLHAENHPEIFKMPESDDFAVAFFDQMLADPITYIYIAEQNGKACGYVLCKLVERPENPFTFAMRYLLIDQVSVSPAVQGKGVGKALLGQVKALAKELNVQKIQLDSWDFNTEAHGFFEKMGFEKFNHRFWRNL